MPKTTRDHTAHLNMRIPPALLAAAHGAARREGVSLSAWVRRALKDKAEKSMLLDRALKSMLS